MDEFRHSLSLFRSTIDSLYSIFEKESILTTCEQIEKGMVQRFASIIRRAKQASDSNEETLIYKILSSMEILMQAYVKNVHEVKKGYERLKKMQEQVRKGVERIGKKDIKKIFREEQMVIVQLEMGFMDGMMKRYERILNEKLDFLEKCRMVED